ncbi:unnamed protein product [Aureobasidium vineae]|uniref:MYND-type domain-containing protein n=1 Tax=Aureobasidium vineae TaxID=2773715 RepID=A0A9N8JNG6_9PEZI|nr:unnamed protein product [Aureobasidium vineae]
MAITKFVSLDHTRIPGFPDAPVHLDRAPIKMVDDVDAGFTQHTDTSNLTTAVGITTILFRWSPDALHAFLDIDAWFSFTWQLTISSVCKYEIGRVENQITIGKLDAEGEKWELMLTYNIATQGQDRGKWIPNTAESMLGNTDLTDAAQIDRLARNFAKDLCLQEVWFTSKGRKHELFVEYALMDPFSDGIPMNPHWLYDAPNVGHCTTCDVYKDVKPLQRCGRCGTAAYCCALHQKLDWPVHKTTCNMSLEDRGQMLKISQHGGLVGWDLSQRLENEDEEEPKGEEAQAKKMSKNPNFVTPQLKGQRQTNFSINMM